MELDKEKLKEKGFDSVIGETRGEPRTPFMKEVSAFVEKCTDLVGQGTGKALICIAVDESLGEDHVQTSQTTMGNGLLCVTGLVEYATKEGSDQLFRQAVGFLAHEIIKNKGKENN